MKLATDFKNFLELHIEDGHLFDTWAWEMKTLHACNAKADKGVDIPEAREAWKRYQEIRHLILEANIFIPPALSWGLSYTKPSEYLTIAFYKSGRPEAQILAEIEKLVVSKFRS
jgi:hypothetical protein